MSGRRSWIGGDLLSYLRVWPLPTKRPCHCPSYQMLNPAHSTHCKPPTLVDVSDQIKMHSKSNTKSKENVRGVEGGGIACFWSGVKSVLSLGKRTAAVLPHLNLTSRPSTGTWSPANQHCQALSPRSKRLSQGVSGAWATKDGHPLPGLLVGMCSTPVWFVAAVARGGSPRGFRYPWGYPRRELG